MSTSVCPFTLSRTATTSSPPSSPPSEIVPAGSLQGRTCVELMAAEPTLTDEQILLRMGVVANEITKLMEHALYFALETGHFTLDSIAAGLKTFDSSTLHVYKVAAEVLLGMKLKLGMNPHIRDIANMLHLCDTKIFSKDLNGNVDDAAYKAVVDKYSVNGYITAAAIQQMCADNEERDRPPEADSSWLSRVGHVVLVAGSAKASGGEFDQAITIAADKQVDGAPAFSIDQFHKIYYNGSAIFKEGAVKLAEQRALAEQELETSFL